MDIYCRTCSEPWDNDSLHEEVEARLARKADNERLGATFTLGTTYDEVAADFRKRGCKALVNGFGPQRSCVPGDPAQTEAFTVIYELMGDDMDGAASSIEDARSAGLI